MSSSLLIFLAQSQLAKSCYKKDIEAPQLSHTVSDTSFTALDDLCSGLECLDEMRGLPYGGVALSSSITDGAPKTPNKPYNKNTMAAGMVAAAQDTEDVQVIEMHKES